MFLIQVASCRPEGQELASQVGVDLAAERRRDLVPHLLARLAVVAVVRVATEGLGNVVAVAVGQVVVVAVRLDAALPRRDAIDALAFADVLERARIVGVPRALLQAARRALDVRFRTLQRQALTGGLPEAGALRIAAVLQVADEDRRVRVEILVVKVLAVLGAPRNVPPRPHGDLRPRFEGHQVEGRTGQVRVLAVLIDDALAARRAGKPLALLELLRRLRQHLAGGALARGDHGPVHFDKRAHRHVLADVARRPVPALAALAPALLEGRAF
mmetsp:Transcript_32365/g.103197  ORF Transcript_32365/g.103197 Transcript_32365/m.103197 type:complete len:272 (+) Transcript_32365:984-1799(+)